MARAITQSIDPILCYRRENPRCRYCVFYEGTSEVSPIPKCAAKRRMAFGAKRCPLYKPDCEV